MDVIFQFLFPRQYIPHGHCYLWQPQLVWLHIIGDALTALAYYSIPLLLLYFVRKRQDIPFQGIFLLFSCFILACGTTHIIEVLTLWHPIYWISGTVKLLTAAVSLYTACQLVELIPKALALPSPVQLEAANQALVKEIQERRQIEEERRRYTTQLQTALTFEAMLKRITDKVRDSLDETQILQTSVAELATVLQVNHCETTFYGRQENQPFCYEYSTALHTCDRVQVDSTEFPEVHAQLHHGETFQFCRLTPDTSNPMGILATPIVDTEHNLGNLWLFRTHPNTFEDAEIRLVQQVASQCAIAIRQARLYQDAQRQVQELERLNQMKDDFLSTVSHELRTPVSNMKMAIHMLRHAPEGDRRQQYLDILQAECIREIELINDLLDLQRLEAQAYSAHYQPLDLSQWLPEVLNTFTSRFQSHHQTFHIDIDSNLPILNSDAMGLERILTELLNNACKYTPPGGDIKLQVHATDSTSALPQAPTTVLAPSVCLVIQNQAEIPTQELSRIFDKFYRIPHTDRWKQGGTGLGLALVKKLVEHLYGNIRVDSQGGWTQFRVELPSLPILNPPMPSHQN